MDHNKGGVLISKKPDTSKLDQLRDKKIEASKEIPPLSMNQSLELDAIIRQGTSYSEDFVLENGKIILIRPLSIAEKNKAMHKGLKEIANTETLDKIWKNSLQKKAAKMETVEDQLNLLLFTEEEDAWLVMFSLRDFSQDIQRISNKYGEKRATEFVKREFNELKNIAGRIKIISGLAKGSKEAVESFQKDLSGIAATIRNESVECEESSIDSKSDPLAGAILKTNKEEKGHE